MATEPVKITDLATGPAEVSGETLAAPTNPRTKTPEQALQRLMALCAKAEKSSGDAMRLMRGWGIAPPERERVLEKLVAQRFIDDARYASAFVREKTRLNGWGAYKIRAALAAKGVDRATIEQALGEIDPHTAQERLERQLRAKYAKFANLDLAPYELRGKLVRYGASLGYDYETVIDQVEKLVRE